MALDAAPKISRLRNLGFALETTTGTAATVADADNVMPVFGQVPMIKYSTEKVAREPQGSLSPIYQGRGARSGIATFETELVGSGTSGGTPIWTRLLTACGWFNSGAVWSPIDNNTKTITLVENLNGRARILRGCMGTFVLKLRRGQAGRFTWTFTGVPEALADAAMPAPTYISTIAPRVGATSFIVGGVSTYRVPEVEIDAGNKVVLREDIQGFDANSISTGYRAAYIPERNPMIKLSPEALNFATKNWETDFLANTTAAMALTIGSASGNTFAFAAPKLDINKNVEEGDREGMLADGLEFLCLRNAAAGDELTITFS